MASVTMCWPAEERPERGVFVQRRLRAVTRYADVRVVCARPWFPLVRRAWGGRSVAGDLPARDERMFCAPGVLKRFDARFFERAALRGLRWLMEETPVDVVDAHFEWPDGVGAWRAARALGLPVVVTLRGKLAGAMRHRAWRRPIVDMLRDADALIAVSRPLAELARDVAGRRDVHVIPNGIDASVFRPVDRVAARDRLGWDASARWVVSVGHLQRLKGFDVAIAALPAIRARCGDVRLALVGGSVGEGRFEARLRRLARRAGARGAVLFAGRLPPAGVNDALNAADVFVLASRAEGCCNALLEAQAAGTPAVATDVGGNREVVCLPALGRLVPAEDAGALAKGVCEALSSPWNRAAIARRGAARSWDHVARETMTVFEAALDRR